MPFLKSPGCNCSCGCLVIEKPNYNTSISANTEHEISHNIPVNCTVDFRSFFDADYFEDTNNQFDIKIKNTAGTSTHKTLTFQGYRDTVNTYDVNTKEYSSVPMEQNRHCNEFYAKRGYKRWLNIDISGETEDFKANETMRVLAVGDILYHIKSVSAGTFSKREGLAVSYLAQYNQVANENDDLCDFGDPSIFRINKERYVFESTETTQTFKVYRAHRNNQYPIDCNTGQEIELKTDLLFRAGFPGTRIETTWSSGQTSESYTFNETLNAGDTYDLFFNSVQAELDVNPYPAVLEFYEDKFYIGSGNQGSTVKVISNASQQGDGHFELETTRVNGFEGESTDVKVFRTQGNSTAVTVVVAVGNSDVTLNFAPGEVVKTFTINHETHDGQTFTAGMIPTNDYLAKRLYLQSTWKNPFEFILRDGTFEFGHIKDYGDNPIRKVGGDELWQYKIPFQRTGWTGSSVRFFVESTSEVELEAYKIYEVTHEETCQATGDNLDCTPYDSCEVISEYHSQQFSIDLNIGLDATYFPPLSHYLNDACSTSNVYWNPFLETESNKGKWIYQETSHFIRYESTETTVVNKDNYYSDSSFSSSSQCGDRNDVFTYPLLNGCISFDNIVYCISADCAGDQYYDFIVTNTGYPTTAQQTFATDPITSGDTDDTCFLIETCETVDLDTTSGLQKTLVTATAIKPERIFTRESPYAASRSDVESACSDTESIRFAHLKNDRFIIDDGTIDGLHSLEHLSVWQWNGYANLDISGPHANVSATYTKDCTTTYVGQEKPLVYDVASKSTALTVSQIATSFSSNLVSGGADYWFEYKNSSNSAENGFYRLTYPNTLTGPFTTADDGSGNTFYNVFEEVGIKLELSLDFYTSEFAGDYAASNWDDYLDGLGGYWSHDTQTITESTANKIQTLDMTVSFSNGFRDLNNTCLGETGPLNSDGIFFDLVFVPEIGDPNLGSRYNAFKFHRSGGSVTNIIDGVFQNENFSSEGSYCEAAAAQLTSACIASGSNLEAAIENDAYCYKLGDPTYTTGSCTSTTNAHAVCCDQAAPVSEVVDYSYYDWSSNQDWNGELEQVAQEYRWFKHELTLGTITDGGAQGTNVNTDTTTCTGFSFSSPYPTRKGKGPADYVFETAKYFFPVKWGDCWTGLDARSESWADSTDEIVGPEKIYALRSMTSGSAPSHAVSGTTFADLDGTAYDLNIDLQIKSNVILKSDFDITVEAFNPSWQKL